MRHQRDSNPRHKTVLYTGTSFIEVLQKEEKGIMAQRNDRVSDVLRVLREMRLTFDMQKGRADVTELRKNAVTFVAKSDARKSAYETIFDACRRRMEPDIKGVEQFDAIAEQWLRSGSMSLREVLLKHTNNPVRRTEVFEFFDESEGYVTDGQSTSDPISKKQIGTVVRFAEESDIEGLKTEVRMLKTKRSRKLRDGVFEAANGICCVCDRDFSNLLGGRGKRVLQVHHRNQLSARKMPSVTTQSDLAVVCANCHLLLHLDVKTALSVDELREMLRADGFFE